MARTFALTYVAIAGAVFAPEALPVLTESQYVAYARTTAAIFHLDKKATETEQNREDNLLPADWAASADRRLRRNYGEASAVEFFAPGVPVISD